MNASVMDHFGEASKNEIVLVSKQVLQRMIQLLMKDDKMLGLIFFNFLSPFHLLRNIIPHRDYLINLAGQLDNFLFYIDDAMQLSVSAH